MSDDGYDSAYLKLPEGEYKADKAGRYKRKNGHTRGPKTCPT